MKGFENLGKNIKYYRELQGKTVEKLAEETFIDVEKLKQIEAGELIYKFKTLEKISSALNISIEKLLDFN